jgi:hypothetical protein
MDHERFDRLTRSLASAQTRRSLLRTLAGGTFAGLLTRVTTRPAGAQEEPASCHANADCDDGTPCTYNVCRDGHCQYPNKREGTTCPGDDNSCTFDVCDGDGHCRHRNKPEGTSCPGDGNACTFDVCDGDGHCRHPNKREGTACTSDGNPCTYDVCDGDGQCRHPNKREGTACPGDGNACTYDVCDGDGHCRHPNKPDGTACRDHNSEHGHCRDGVCRGD